MDNNEIEEQAGPLTVANVAALGSEDLHPGDAARVYVESLLHSSIGALQHVLAMRLRTFAAHLVVPPDAQPTILALMQAILQVCLQTVQEASEHAVAAGAAAGALWPSVPGEDGQPAAGPLVTEVTGVLYREVIGMFAARERESARKVQVVQAASGSLN